MLKYVFMGSPPLAATILEKLCTELYPPVAVVTQVAKAAGRGQKISATAVEQYAKSQDLNVIATLDVNSPNTLPALKVFHPDLILVAAFGQILKQEVLDLPKLYCLNVHASLLPKYRGAAPFQRAIWNGDKVTGITVQKMARKLDTGDILLQKSLPIDPTDTSESLLAKLATLGGVALVEAVKSIETGKYRFTPQDEKEATYASKIAKEEAVISWSQPAQRIENQIRALQPWPVAETYLGKDRLKIFRATVEPGGGKKPGAILTDAKTFLRVQCGDNQALSLTEIQLENRKRLDIKNFLMAYRGSFPHTEMGPPTST